MILTVIKHGRTENDSAAVAAHLAKTENESAVIAEIGNTIVAETLGELFRISAIYRDSSPTAKCAFFHCTINPEKNQGDTNLLYACHRVRLELDPEGTRPFVIVFHTKKRSERGGSDRHAHLLLSNVDSRGVALDDRYTILRCERLSMELGYEFGEKAVLGRHFRSSVKALKKTRPEVAEWLIKSFGTDPPLPQSAMSSGLRALARNEGRSLPKAKAAARSAWERADSIEKFKSNLAEVGLSVHAGNRPNVWIVVDSLGGLVGSCDRILKVPRLVFQDLMDRSFAEAGVPRKTDSNLMAALPTGHNRDQTAYRPTTFRLRTILKMAERMRSLRREFGKEDEAQIPEATNGTDIWGVGRRPQPR